MLAAVLGGLGIALYAGLWLVLPTDSHFEDEAPGSRAPRRGGRRPGRIRRLDRHRPGDRAGRTGLRRDPAAGGGPRTGAVFWPVFIGLVGIALLWRQADEAQRERWLDTTGRVDPVRAVLGSGGWASYARIAAGVGLIITALVLFSFAAGRSRWPATSPWPRC